MTPHRTLSLLPLTVKLPRPDGGTDGGVTEELIPIYTAHVETFCQRSICFLHIEQTFVCLCILVAQSVRLYVWARVLPHLTCVL